MVVAKTEKLRLATTHREEWRETAENLRILGKACLEIAEQMEEKLGGEQKKPPRQKTP